MTRRLEFWIAGNRAHTALPLRARFQLVEHRIGVGLNLDTLKWSTALPLASIVYGLNDYVDRRIVWFRIA